MNEVKPQSGGAADGSVRFRYDPPAARSQRRGRIVCIRETTGAVIDSDRIDLDDARERERYIRRILKLLPHLHQHQVADGIKEAQADATRAGDAAPAEREFDENDLPEVVLPGAGVPILMAAGTLGRLMDKRGGFYIRGGTLVQVGEDEDDRTKVLKVVTNATLASTFELVASLKRFSKDGDLVGATCNEQTAKLVSHSAPFQSTLPRIRLLSNCPVLIERDGKLLEVSGYDRESGILANGEPSPRVELPDALQLLGDLLRDFAFPTPSDRSRAFAAIITPALVHGGLMRGRAPIDLGEADDSQTGKGYRNKLTAAVYRAIVQTVTQKSDRGGVGSLEEALNAKLLKGYSFISIDNVRGNIDSPAIESLLTEERYSARVPYQEPIEIDPRRVILQLTSNKADITVDLANRSSCVRLIKQQPGYQFATFPEGDLLERVRKHQPRYLGAVFAVVRAWFEAGRPLSNECRHDFRMWAKTLDWIVVNILKEAPLLDGHKETQARMTSPALNWLRDVALAVKRAGALETVLQAHHLLDILDQDGKVAIPGMNEHDDVNADDVRSRVFQALGKKLAQCFAKAGAGASMDTLAVDGIYITRYATYDKESRREVKRYLFSEEGNSSVAPDDQQKSGASGADIDVDGLFGEGNP